MDGDKIEMSLMSIFFHNGQPEGFQHSTDVSGAGHYQRCQPTESAGLTQSGSSYECEAGSICSEREGCHATIVYIVTHTGAAVSDTLFT